MSDRSYVTMETAVCPVCGTEHATGSLLLNRRLRPVFEHRTATHWAMCPEHEKLRADGYVALVEIDERKSRQPYTPSSVHRTGVLAHVRRAVWDNIFNTPVGDHPMVFVEQGVIDSLQAATPGASNTQGGEACTTPSTN